jgi:hypothetical protein
VFVGCKGKYVLFSTHLLTMALGGPHRQFVKVVHEIPTKCSLAFCSYGDEGLFLNKDTALLAPKESSILFQLVKLLKVTHVFICLLVTAFLLPFGLFGLPLILTSISLFTHSVLSGGDFMHQRGLDVQCRTLRSRCSSLFCFFFEDLSNQERGKCECCALVCVGEASTTSTRSLNQLNRKWELRKMMAVGSNAN